MFLSAKIQIGMEFAKFISFLDEFSTKLLCAGVFLLKLLCWYDLVIF